MNRHPIFQKLWYLINGLLVVSLFLAIYAVGWEYSTRRYLKGFADAIIPASASGEGKTEAILSWMRNGPARAATDTRGIFATRDPEETLNYRALLKVCGSATNAFVNLANSSGIPARRLLLLNVHRQANHVVAEVYVDGRWIVVDPSFRTILRGSDGQPLTRQQLNDPQTLAFATRNLAGYSPLFTYDHTAYLRMSRIPVIGSLLRRVLDSVLPGWDNSVYWTLLLERESLAATVLTLLLLIFCVLVRYLARRFGEKRLDVRTVSIRKQLRQVYSVLLNGSD
jgi:transglutaminase superfamily protein